MKEISSNIIKAHALDNAIKHKGKASEGAVLSALFSEGLEKTSVKDYLPKISEIVSEVNDLIPQEQKNEFEKLKNSISKREVREMGELPELKNVKESGVVMRFAPFPSGPLHIGNARPLILNDEYVKKYGGKLILVMDDTIGSEEKPIEKDAYRLIEEGVRWLGANFDKKIVYKSDRLETYYAYAEEMIKKGYMYVCKCNKESIREERVKGIECACRILRPEEHMKRWESMFNSPEGSFVVRLKTNMQDSDPAFRDRVMLRISERPHPRTGTKYRVYPTLDFSWAIDDHLLGTTHILRGMELAIETRVEKFIWDIFGWTHPEIIYNGHFAIEGVKISKSKGAKEVKAGTFSGWNDPRTWSLQSLRDRGIRPEAIREFILNMGLKKTSVKIPVSVLYSINKKYVENSKRFFFLEDPVEIKISGAPPINARIPYHPDGTKGFKEYKTDQEFLIQRSDLNSMEDGNYRLMHLLNFKSDKVVRLKPRTFSFISENPDEKLKVKFMQWLISKEKNIPVRIMLPSGVYKEGLGEPRLRDIDEWETVQFERVGFAKLYKKTKDRLDFWFAHN